MKLIFEIITIYSLQMRESNVGLQSLDNFSASHWTKSVALNSALCISMKKFILFKEHLVNM